MNRRIPVLAAAITLALLSPAALAGWIGFGESEPSTSYDTSSYMYGAPNSGAANQVYFNAYPVWVLSSLNPNSPTLDTGLDAWGSQIMGAMLGVWRDCNGDGYVGMAEQGVVEYRAELLLDDSACEPEPYVPGEAVHNDGTWVYEYIPFVMVHPCTWEDEEAREDGSGHDCEGFTPPAYYMAQAERFIFVNNTKMWGDFGAPDAAPGGSSCPITPIPEGSTAHTGLLLRYATCFRGAGTAIDDALAIVDPNNDSGLRFDDPSNPQDSADHPLVLPLPTSLYGNPRQGEESTGLIERDSENPDPTFTTWDCSGGAGSGTHVEDPTGELSHVGVADPTGSAPSEVGGVEILNENDEIFTLAMADENGRMASVRTPAPSLANPEGSLLQGADETYNGIYVHGVHTWWLGGYDNVSQEGDCAPADSDDRENVPVNNQKGMLDGSTASSAQVAAKIDNDYDFSFGSMPAGLNPWSVDITLEELGGDLYDHEFKTLVGARAPPVGSHNWFANIHYVLGTPRHGTDTTDESGVAPPAYNSFYVQLDLDEMSRLGMSLPSGTVSFVYGSDQCGATPSGGTNMGWNCDPDAWWLDVNGNNVMPRYSTTRGEYDRDMGARVGDTYHLRDVDCVDQSVAGVPVGNIQPCV